MTKAEIKEELQILKQVLEHHKSTSIDMLTMLQYAKLRAKRKQLRSLANYIQILMNMSMK